MCRIMPIPKMLLLHLFQDETGTHAQNLRHLGSCLLFAANVEYAHDQKDVDPRIILLLSFQSICSANSHCALIRSNVQTKRIVRSQMVLDTHRPAPADACQDRAW